MRNYLVSLKNNTPWLLLLWHRFFLIKGRKQSKKLSDLEAVNQLYFKYSGKYPNLVDPKTFSEKQQWMKLNYKNPLK